jgi:hypothetical protein
MYRPHQHSLALISALLLLGCGGSQSSTRSSDVTGITTAAPIFAIASPVAQRGSSAVSHAVASAALPSARWNAGNPPPASPPQPALSFPEQLAQLQNRLAGTTVSECLAGVGFQVMHVSAECYGPMLSYLNHPDAKPPYMPSGTGGCLVTGDTNGCLPSGDLGIWNATNGDKGEACTAATMNSQVLSSSSLVNAGLTLMAGMICAAKVDGAELPSAGAPLDMASVLASNIPSASFDQAQLERLTDQADGRPTWRISLTGIIDGTSFMISLTHAPGENDESAGRLHGYVDRNDSIDRALRRGFSAVYVMTGGKVNYELRAGQIPTTVPIEALFDADGNYQLDGLSPSHMGEGNLVYERAEIDANSGLGTMIHAWQAGAGDGYTRVFQAHTEAGASGPDVGFGYFGFGPPVSSLDLGTIAGMWCNWAGPGSLFHGWENGIPNVNTTNVQAQSMSRDTTSGLFVPVVNHVKYAPTNSCNAEASSGFVYLAGQKTNPELSGLTAEDVANELVPYGDIGAIPPVPSPTPIAVSP